MNKADRLLLSSGYDAYGNKLPKKAKKIHMHNRAKNQSDWLNRGTNTVGGKFSRKLKAQKNAEDEDSQPVR